MPIEIRAKDYIDKNLESLKLRCHQVSQFKVPKMKVFLVGENSSSLIYVNYKKKFCEKIGALCEIHHLETSISLDDFRAEVEKANKAQDVDGIIIQLPLPKQLKELDVFSLVHPNKDIDGFHPLSIKNIFENKLSDTDLIPCTPKGVLKLIDEFKIELQGQHVIVIGRSHIVGRPLSMLLLNRNATVTMCHSYSQNLENLCQSADVIISAVGKPKYLDKNFVSKDKKQVFIDIGISRDEYGKISGDINFEEISKKEPFAISPVPGGVGPMTVYSLVENLLIATEKKLKKNEGHT